MSAQPCLPNHRTFSKQGRLIFIVCLASTLICPGCSSLKIQQMQSHAARGDFEWITAQTIDCGETSQRCSQLHLIKGDACIHLAESGRQPADNYACAADELEKGLALKPAWEDIGEQLEKQERLCESLQSLQALQSGAVAEQTSDRLMEAAKTLYQLAPESVPAVYYLSLSRWKQVESRLSAIKAADRFPVCSRLKRTATHVLLLMDTASRQPLPDWDHFAERYQRLAFDLGKGMYMAGCH